MHRLFSVVLVLGALGAGCNGSCGSSQTQVSTEAGPAPPAGLTAEEAAQVVAKVGTRTITLGDFAGVLERMGQYERLRYQAPERRRELLEEMITVELLAQEAIEKGYDQDPATALELQNALRDAVLADVRNKAKKPADIPVDQVRAYFDAHKDDYVDPERRRVAAIVLADEAQAKKVLADYQRKPGAEHFGELVRAHSREANAKADVPADLAGDLGLVSPPGDPRGSNTRVPEAVRAAIFTAATIGDVLPEPVLADGQAYVVRLVQISEGRARTFEEAERSIRVRLAQEASKADEDALIAALAKEFPVQIDEAALATVRVPAPAEPTLPPGAPVPVPTASGEAAKP